MNEASTNAVPAVILCRRSLYKKGRLLSCILVKEERTNQKFMGIAASTSALALVKRIVKIQQSGIEFNGNQSL